MLLSTKIKRYFKDNKDEVVVAVTVGTIMGVGFILGRKYQKLITLEHLKGALSIATDSNPMFPNTMPISEIKEVLSTMDGARFMDALIVDINGAQRMITRVCI